MFHKKFHIKIFLTKNYGFLFEKRAQFAPDFVWFLYVFFICVFYMYFLYVFCKCCFFNSIFRRRLGKSHYSGFFLITPY